jgi:diaminohydroxyphosphoribosylaminopyrimidine deaminase/5-amino-6-(5-phosphoribosylamino)uracil reductase
VWVCLAIEEAALARGSTGDNPWVGCVIVDARGELLGRGHTLGPGEDHAEVAAARDAQLRGHNVVGATLCSTLEPCSFHGRTPACSQSIGQRGIARIVIGMRDPHPRVNGAGVLILRNGGGGGH